jgi:hypothetical protein
MAWTQRFFDPIPVPNGRALVTLRDAGNYVLSLPEDEQALPHWQAAAEALTLVGEHGGDTMLPRIAMMRALNHGKLVPEPPPRRKRAKAYRII